jgi:hypothetical protein
MSHVPSAEMRRSGADPWDRCTEIHGASTEMLTPKVVLVEEAVVGEHRDIASESSRWNLMAAVHQKWRLGHSFGIVGGRWDLLHHHDFSFFYDFFFSCGVCSTPILTQHMLRIVTSYIYISVYIYVYIYVCMYIYVYIYMKLATKCSRGSYPHQLKNVLVGLSIHG